MTVFSQDKFSRSVVSDSLRLHELQHARPPLHLGCFCVLAVVNSAAVNIGVYVSFGIMVFSGSVPRSGIARSYGSSVFSFFIVDTTYLEENS